MGASRRDSAEPLLYGSIGLGLVAVGLLTAYLLVRRSDTRHLPPSDRAERLIEECEQRIQQIQQSIATVQTQLETNGKVPAAVQR